MTQKRISLGFLYRGFKGGTWPSNAKKPGYLPQTKEVQLLRLHSSTTYIWNIRWNPRHWSNWDFSIFLPRLLRPFWWTLLAAWWRLRGARGADEKGWNDYSGPGVEYLSRFFGIYFTTLKVTSYRKPRCKEWIWRQRKCLNKNNSIWIPWHIWSCKGGLGAFYLWRPRDYWTCCFLSSIRVWGGVGDKHLKGGQVQL